MEGKEKQGSFVWGAAQQGGGRKDYRARKQEKGEGNKKKRKKKRKRKTRRKAERKATKEKNRARVKERFEGKEKGG